MDLEQFATSKDWDRRFLGMAQYVSLFSKDPSTKCGAVIVRPDRTVASVGFNGFPRGCSDHADLYDERDLKYDRVIHAEVNAILAAAEPLTGYTMYVWPPGPGPTCARCATCVIQSGIKRVVNIGGEFGGGRWEQSIRRGLEMYQEAGVEYTQLTA